MPPLTQLYLYVNNNTDLTNFVTPTGGVAGDDVITDNSGYAAGTFVLPNTSNIKIPTGRIRFAFINDPNSFTNASAYAEAGFISAGTLTTEQRTIVSTKEPVLIRNNVTSTRTDTNTSSRDIVSNQVTWIDPVAQTFLVDGTIYPNGIYLSSTDLYFATKDSTLPVSIQIRPTVSGFPSSSVILPMSEVYKNPADVNIPVATEIYDGIGPATNFEFESPVYLAPGEYCLVVISNSDKYNLYAAEIGQTVLGTTNRITAVPYLGVLFKSQNGSTWTASQSEDLCFKLNQCVFNRGQISFTLDLESPTESTDFDLLKLTTQELNFGNDTSIAIVWVGLTVVEIVRYKKIDTVELSNNIKELIAKHGIHPSQVIADSDGLGAGVVDNIRCTPFVNNSSPLHKQNYGNLKSQCYVKLSDMIREGKISINVLDSSIVEELTQELLTVRLKDVDKDNKIQVISKDEQKKILGKSPDLSDALMFRMYWELKNMNTTARYAIARI
jgi:hypothetical protein